MQVDYRWLFDSLKIGNNKRDFKLIVLAKNVTLIWL